VFSPDLIGAGLFFMAVLLLAGAVSLLLLPVARFIHFNFDVVLRGLPLAFLMPILMIIAGGVASGRPAGRSFLPDDSDRYADVFGLVFSWGLISVCLVSLMRPWMWF